MGKSKQRPGPAKTRRHSSNFANTATKIHPYLASFPTRTPKSVDNSEGDRNQPGQDDEENAKRRHRLDREICDSNASSLIQSLSKPLLYNFGFSIGVGKITESPFWCLASLPLGLCLTGAFIALVFILSRGR